MRRIIHVGMPEYVPPAPDNTNTKDLCDSTHDGYQCTLKAGHEGQHVAHIFSPCSIVEIWD